MNKRKKNRNHETQKSICYSYSTMCTVVTVQNFKKRKKKEEDKVANQNGTVNQQWKMLYEQCKNSVEKIA